MTLLTTNRSGQGAFHAPSFAQTFADGLSIYACALRPIFQAERDPLMCDFAGAASVAGLLMGRGPFAIVGRIFAVVVDTFDGCADWTTTHISQEVLERSPSLAYRYAASAVVRIMRIFGVGAALDHHAPYSILRDRGAFPSAPVLGGSDKEDIKAKAPAALGISACQQPEWDERLIAAVALAVPYHIALFSTRCGFYSRQASKTLSPYVSYRIRHNWIIA